MKKTYINPNIEVVAIKTVSMLAYSMQVNGSKEVTNTNDLLGRDFDFDDEE